MTSVFIVFAMGILMAVFRRKRSKQEETSLTEDQLSTYEVRSEYSTEFFESMPRCPHLALCIYSY